LTFNSPKLDIDTGIALVLLLDILEREIKGLGLAHLAGACQLLRQRDELVVVSAVVEEFWVLDGA
jgi:hypothetical protein